MSRLWADRLLISLAPDAVAVARLSGLWRPKLISKKLIEGDKPVDALRAAICALEKERLRATVVLSNRFVRYAIVPFDAAVSGPEEELALARFHFSRIHGERAKGWALRVSDAPQGAPRLACAIDADLLAAIRGCFPSASGTRLASVQPYLMAAYNRWGRAVAREDAWLVLPEREGACLAYATRAGWLAAHMVKSGLGQAPALAEGLEREQLRLAAAPRAALVHGAPPPEPSGWKMSRLTLPPLEGFFPQEDGAYAMALCAR